MNLGGKRLYRRAKNIFSRTYKPHQFWHKRGETYILEKESSFPKHELIKYLRTIQFDSVLEFGCGYGRITKLIFDNSKPSNYTAFNVSAHQVYNARLECNNVNFSVSSIKEFTSDTKFDLVICVTVFIHIPSKDIKDTIEHLLSFSKKHFIHDDKGYDPEWKNTRTTHTFRHDFARIYSEIGSLELKVTPTTYGTTIFHAQK